MAKNYKIKITKAYHIAIEDKDGYEVASDWSFLSYAETKKIAEKMLSEVERREVERGQGMSKYYKAEEVIRAIAENLAWGDNRNKGKYDCTDGWEEWIETAEDVVYNLPTIDIVHCRECKYYEDPKHKIFENCVKWKDSHGIILPIKPNDSCSYGERIKE